MPEEHQNFKNRRTSARANIHVIAHFTDPFIEDAVEEAARISDISEKGALIVTLGKKFFPGAMIKMNFVIPGDGIADVLGKIKYCKMIEEGSYQSGIEFVNLEEKNKLALRGCVASHLKDKK